MFKFFKSKLQPKPLEITVSNFNDLIYEYEHPVLLQFKASWCQPCHVMLSLINRLAKEDEFKKGIRIGIVDIDQNPPLAKHFTIRSVPTLLFIHNKKVINRFSGLMPYSHLKRQLEEFLAHYGERI